jgi:multiple sugar transport system substrate-binding protein
MHHRVPTWLAILAILALIVSACGPAAPASSGTPGTTGAAPTSSGSGTAAAEPCGPPPPPLTPTATEEPTAPPSPGTSPSPELTPIITPAPDVAGKTTVRWFVGLGTGTDANQLEVEQKVVEDFNAANPDINLVLEVINYNSARDTLATEIASGNPPDIVGPVGVGGAEAFHGQWCDLTSLIAESNYDLTQFSEGAIDFYKVGGEGQIGIPFAIFPSMMYYQKEHFDEAELNYPPHKVGEKYEMPDGTEVEWDYDTVQEIAKILTVDSNGNDATSADFDPEKIVQYGYEPQYQDARAIGSYFGAGSLVADDEKTAQIPEPWAAAWKWDYENVWTHHVTPTLAVRNGEAMAENPFNSGNVSMALTHLWYTCCIPDAGDSWDIGIVPSYNGEITANFNADTFRILKASKHPREAFKVLSYLLGDASLELLGVYGGMPARTADQDKFLEGLDAKFPWGPDWQVAVDMIPYADNPSFEAFVPNYNKTLDEIVTFLTKLHSTPGLDVDQETEALKGRLQAIYDEVQ